MENKELNIAAILKGKPKGTKLYSPTFGCIKFNGVHKDKVYFYSEDTNSHSVKQNGKMYDGGECIIFPSKEMRDWSKYAWKKGDVLTYERYVCIFEKWLNDDYTKFVARHLFSELDGYFDKPLEVHSPFNRFVTEYWTKNTNNRNIDFYISKIEEFNNNGKLNLSTLQIEQPKPEFKDGDIVVSEGTKTFVYLFGIKDGRAAMYAYLDIDDDEIICGDDFSIETFNRSTLRLATDSEKQKLFDALAKEGKRWDADTKQIVELKQECEFKTFDKVLVRDEYNEIWQPAIFISVAESEKYPYFCNNISSSASENYKECIDYEGNEDLAFTNNAF